MVARIHAGNGGLTRRLPPRSSTIEPGLGEALLARWGFIPLLFDYEVEIGVMLLDDLEENDLENAKPRLGWFVANDLTLRTCQALGEGTRGARRASKAFVL